MAVCCYAAAGLAVKVTHETDENAREGEREREREREIEREGAEMNQELRWS